MGPKLGETGEHCTNHRNLAQHGAYVHLKYGIGRLPLPGPQDGKRDMVDGCMLTRVS